MFLQITEVDAGNKEQVYKGEYPMRNVGGCFNRHGRTRANPEPKKAKKRELYFSRKIKDSGDRGNDAVMAPIASTRKTSDKSLFKRFCMRCENGAHWIQIGFLKLRSRYVSFTNNEDAIRELDKDIVKLKNKILENNGKEKIIKPSRPVIVKARNGDLAGAGRSLYANAKDKVTGAIAVATARIGNLLT